MIAMKVFQGKKIRHEHENNVYDATTVTSAELILEKLTSPSLGYTHGEVHRNHAILLR